MGGGEPLTKWELLKETVNKILFLSENHSRKIMFAITTNGTLLNEERIKFLKKHNFTINLSFDILPDIQNIQRSNIKGNSFEVVNKNICNLTDQSLNFSIRSTITSLNVGLQKEMVEFVHRNYPTVKRIHLEPATNSATDIIWINFIDNFIKARELGKSYDLDVVCSISNSINKLRKVFCPGEFTVTSEGDVVSCHRVSSNRDSNLRYFKYGQLTGKGYEVDRGLYNTQKDELYIHSQKFCNDCFARLHCAGYCPQAILTTIDNNLTMEKMCGYIRRLLTNVIEQDLTYKLKYSSN